MYSSYGPLRFGQMLFGYTDDGALTFAPNASFLDYPVNRKSILVGAPDINADSIPDMVWHDSASGIVEILLLGRVGVGIDARLFKASGSFIATDPAYRIAAIGDYDGDGFVDDFLWDHSTSHVLYMWFGRGDGSFDSTLVASYAPSWSVLP